MFVIHDARDGKFNWVGNITPNTAGIILVDIVNGVASTYIPEFGLKWCLYALRQGVHCSVLYILHMLYMIIIIMCNMYNIYSTGHPGF